MDVGGIPSTHPSVAPSAKVGGELASPRSKQARRGSPPLPRSWRGGWWYQGGVGGCNRTHCTQSPPLLGFISMVHTRGPGRQYTHTGRGGGQERRERMGCRLDGMEGEGAIREQGVCDIKGGDTWLLIAAQVQRLIGSGNGWSM